MISKLSSSIFLYALFSLSSAFAAPPQSLEDVYEYEEDQLSFEEDEQEQEVTEDDQDSSILVTEDPESEEN